MNTITPKPGKQSALLSYFSLFTSVSTLLCCALPSLLVLFGLGASVASVLSFLPWLVTLYLVQAFASRIAVLENRHAFDAIRKSRLFLHGRLMHGLKLIVAMFVGTLVLVAGAWLLLRPAAGPVQHAVELAWVARGRDLDVDVLAEHPERDLESVPLGAAGVGVGDEQQRIHAVTLEGNAIPRGWSPEGVLGSVRSQEPRCCCTRALRMSCRSAPQTEG